MRVSLLAAFLLLGKKFTLGFGCSEKKSEKNDKVFLHWGLVVKFYFKSVFFAILTLLGPF